MSSYFWPDAQLQSEIERVIGSERFGPYLAERGNLGDALRLYATAVPQPYSPS